MVVFIVLILLLSSINSFAFDNYPVKMPEKEQSQVITNEELKGMQQMDENRYYTHLKEKQELADKEKIMIELKKAGFLQQLNREFDTVEKSMPYKAFMEGLLFYRSFYPEK